VAFVTCRWAIEATAFARVQGDRITWSAKAGHAREHLLGLVRWLPTRADPRSFVDPGQPTAASWTALRGGTPVSAPWNLAMIVAGAASALTGRLLTGPTTTAQAAMAAALGALAALGVVTAARARLLAVAVGGAVLLSVLAWQSAGAPVAVLPWLAVVLAYVYFVGHSMRTMGALGRRLQSGSAVLLAPLARVAIGRETWTVLTAAERADG
jgi:hypothetical protein